MKKTYLTPLIEVVHIGHLENFCTSVEEYTGQSGSFDDDSD